VAEASALLETETWIAFGASLAIGLLIGLERERNPSAKAGVRTFALVALLGTLAAMVGERTESAWTIPLGLAAVAGMLVTAYARDPRQDDPGTTTVVAAIVCYLLGVLAGVGEAPLAGALGIAVTALLYFKPELEGLSMALQRQDQVSILQFLVVTFIVLPLLPDRGYGPYEVLNPRNIWLMVVLIAGIGLASYIAQRVAGERHGLVLTGILGGLVSSTATTVLYARRSAESPSMERVALTVIPLANLVPIGRIAVLALFVAPAVVPALLPMLIGALAAGILATLVWLRRTEGDKPLPVPAIGNPTELGVALRFAALYAIVLVASAWLADLAGSRGLYAAALASGMVDIDPIVLSALNLYSGARAQAHSAVLAIGLAYASNLAFKAGVLVWFNRRLARRALWPMSATVAGGALALALL
jgi:uncharacterized membrane protein (DUF4010 family)